MLRISLQRTIQVCLPADPGREVRGDKPLSDLKMVSASNTGYCSPTPRKQCHVDYSAATWLQVSTVHHVEWKLKRLFVNQSGVNNVPENLSQPLLSF
jgi:hypothetical protein